jgi:hypothetical protein
MSFSEPSLGTTQDIACYVTPLEVTVGRHPPPPF